MALKTDGGERLTISIPETAKLLGIGRNECYRAAKRGELPTIIIGRRILVSRAGLLRMTDEARAQRGLNRKLESGQGDHGHDQAKK